MFCCPLLDYWTGDVLNFAEVAGSKENEQALVERVFVDLRDARTVGSAPKLIVAPDQLPEQQRFVHPAIAVGEGFQENVAALKIIG